MVWRQVLIGLAILTMGNFKTVYGYAAGVYGSLSDTTIDTFGNRTMHRGFLERLFSWNNDYWRT